MADCGCPHEACVRDFSDVGDGGPHVIDGHAVIYKSFPLEQLETWIAEARANPIGQTSVHFRFFVPLPAIRRVINALDGGS